MFLHFILDVSVNVVVLFLTSLSLSLSSLGWNNCGDEVALELVKVLSVCHKLSRIE